LAIDVPHVHALKKEYDATLAKLEKDIWQAAGKEFNVASPKQLGEVLFTHLGLAPKRHKKTAGGAFSTKESELEKIKDMHPVVAMVLEYRERAKLRSTYIDVMLELTTPEGRLHTTLIQAGASTGRMASENPNLQNIPNKTELGRAIRRSFIAGPGYDLVAFDYSQMELRIAAFLSEDEALLEIFRKGEDVHTAVAAQVFKVPLNEVTKDMRRQAKVINFGVMYGMGVTALQGNLGTDRATAQQFYDDYFTTFSGLALYLKKVAYEAGKRGYTETLFGRRRYMPELRSHLPYIRAQAERMATNAPIQGTGADIVKRAMIAVDDYVEKNNLQEDVRMLLQVHDELLFEIKPSAYARVEPEITRLMESVVPLEQTKGVVCKVDSKRGKNWSEMKE
jgi:DNA polymerase-1